MEFEKEVLSEGEKFEKDKEFIHNFYYQKIGLCGCGSPGDRLLLIKSLLNQVHDRTDDYRKADLSKDGTTGLYEKHQRKLHGVFGFAEHGGESMFSDVQNGIVQFVMDILDEADLLEHGGSIGGAWLSRNGEKMREILNGIKDEDLEDYV